MSVLRPTVQATGTLDQSAKLVRAGYNQISAREAYRLIGLKGLLDAAACTQAGGEHDGVFDGLAGP